MKYIDLVSSLVTADGGNMDEAVSAGSGEYKNLKVTSDNGIYTIMFNRPNKKNAIDVEVSYKLKDSRFNFKIRMYLF